MALLYVIINIVVIKIGLFSSIEAFRFKDTVFYKESSDLQDRYDALKRLNEEYSNNEELDKLVELRPKTLEELKNSNILPEIKVKTHGEEIIKEILK